MPAKTTIFNTKAAAIHNFALAPRNTIIFSPHGRFVLVAGFGNLAGQMDIYDLTKDFKKICTIEASNASVCEWSPDEKYILTATLSPRLRVDNGVRIWHVGGGLMYNEELTELYQVTWRPQSTFVPPLDDPLHPMPTPHASALAYLGTVKTPSKPAGAYRPPGARGTVTPLAFRREDEGGAAYVSNGSMSLGTLGVNGFGKPRRREVPGAEAASTEDTSAGQVPGSGPGSHGIPIAGLGAADGDETLSKAAVKNKKKREAKKAKEAADKVAGLAPPIAPGTESVAIASPNPNRNTDRVAQLNGSIGTAKTKKSSPGAARDQPQSHNLPPKPVQPQQHQNPQAPASTNQQPHRPSTPPANGSTSVTNPDSLLSPGGGPSANNPHEKKIRALLKKLRAIDDLKMRRAGGEKLEGTQIKKMETEDGVRTELESLGWVE